MAESVICDKPVILHLCADIGSDSYPYQIDGNYDVVLVGKDIGVENYSPVGGWVRGIIANPVCKQFSRARSGGKSENPHEGMWLVQECLRVIREARPEWWVIENPAMGDLSKFLGKPKDVYQPYNFGSPWTKRTALWGSFNMPKKIYERWEDLPNYNDKLYTKPKRNKPSLADQHKTRVSDIPEFAPFVSKIVDDEGFRSLCSQNFANKFKEVNP